MAKIQPASKIYMSLNIYQDATQISLDWSINDPITVLQIVNPKTFSEDFTSSVRYIHHKLRQLKSSEKVKGFVIWSILKGVFMLHSSEIFVATG